MNRALSKARAAAGGWANAVGAWWHARFFRRWELLTPSGEVQMVRFTLVKSERFGAVMLHHMRRGDYDRCLHTHPWPFLSVVLSGQYVDVQAGGKSVLRQAGSVRAYPAAHAHRVELCVDDDGNELPAWTLVLRGPKRDTWGFLTPAGFVPWRRYVEQRREHGSPCE